MSGIILGKWHGRILQSQESHVLLCGLTGSGKDRGVNLPTTLSWPHSMVILDVKDGGENYAVCANARRQLGPVYRFAPSMREAHGFNVLDGVRVGEPEAFRDAALIAQSLTAPLVRHEGTTDSGQFFAVWGQTVLRTLILHGCVAHPGACSLAGLAGEMTATADCLTALTQSPDAEVRQMGQRLQAMAKGAEKQFDGIWDQALKALDCYQDPLIAYHTGQSDFSPLELQYGPQPVTLYLTANAPTEMQYLYPVYRTVVETLMHHLMQQPRDVPRRPLLWLLNEFPVLGYMGFLEEAPSLARSYHMRFLLPCQDTGQLFGVFGHYTPLWANCATRVFQSPMSDETADRVVHMLGPETVETATESYGRQGRSRSQHFTGRPLLTISEVLGLPLDREIVWGRGCPHPILADKLRWDVDRF
jgi:type IV secretion system protein VirD4